MAHDQMTLAYSYDYRLVALSVLIAICASYTALDLAGRVTASRGRSRVVWLASGSVAMGLGIWSMHYIGMLAYILPVPVRYHWPTVLVSLVAAAAASAVALYVVSRRKMGLASAALGSIVMGAGIAAMHYIGMAAMVSSAMCQFNIPIVALSVLLAVAISFVGLWLLFRVREDLGARIVQKAASAVMMGLAIPVMHYTGMAAVTFTPADIVPDLSEAISISSLGTGVIVVVTAIVLGLAVLVSLTERRLSLLAQDLQPRERRYRERAEAVFRSVAVSLLLMLVGVSIWVYDGTGRLVDANELVGHSGVVLVTLADLQSSFDESVAGLLAYDLSASQSDLDRIARARQRTADKLRSLRSLTQHDLEQQNLLARIKAPLEALYRYGDHGVDLRRHGLGGEVQREIARREPQLIIRENRRIMAQMVNREDATLSAQSREAADSARNGLVIELFSAAAMFIVFAGVYVLIQTDMNKKARTLDELRRIEEQLNAALVESEARGLHNLQLAACVDASHDAIITVRLPEGTIQSWNAGAGRIYDCTAAEAVGEPFGDLILPGTSAEIQDILARMLRGDTVDQFESERIRKDGKHIYIALTISSIREVEGRVIGASAVARDITEQKRNQRRQKTEHRVTCVLAEAASLTEAGLGILEAICTGLGWQAGVIWRTASESDRLHCASLWHVPERDVQAFGVRCREASLAIGEGLPGRVWETGRVVWIEDIEREGTLLQAAESQASFRGAFAFPIRFGNDVTGVAEFLTDQPCTSDGDSLSTYASLGAQIGQFIARKESEEGRKRIEGELLHARKLEAVGQLAAGIAHEINTPIQFVGDNTRFLQDSFAGISQMIEAYERVYDQVKLGETDPEILEQAELARQRADWAYLRGEAPKALDQTLEGVARVARIVRAMKEFSHVDQGAEKSAANLNKALESTLVVAGNELKYAAEVETSYGDLPPVMCHVGDLNQVFLNLLVNAAHAVADSVQGTNTLGKIRVRTRPEKDWVDIAISDSGTGIPEEIRDKIFNPFFTTKGVGKGTGQGLAIARAIVVEKHGGTLTFETETGKGTTFHVRLPLIPSIEDSSGTLVRHGSEMVLVEA